MIRVRLYEEIMEDRLTFITCHKSELKSKLTSIIEEGKNITDYFIVRVMGEDCTIYMRNGKGTHIIRISPAARIRIETGFRKLKVDLIRIEDALARHGIDPKKEKVFYIRQIDLDEDFIIMDVYVAM